MRRSIGAILVIPILAVILWGCGGPPPTASSDGAIKADPSFAQDIQSIFNRIGCNIAGCHDQATAQAGMVLLTGQAYLNLVNVTSTEVPAKKRVAPGNLAGSYLVDKIEGTQSVGVRMPNGLAPLNTVDIQNIRNWISNGAKNN